MTSRKCVLFGVLASLFLAGTVARAKGRALASELQATEAKGSPRSQDKLARPARANDGQRTIRLPVTRDTWFSNVGPEADGASGGAARLKLKSHQEMSLVDVDTKPLVGRVVVGATLKIRSMGEPRAKRLTVGTFGSEWFEGTASGYAHEVGSSTHNHMRYPDVRWAGPGSDLCSVILGQGGTTWRMAEASPPDADGWQSIVVDPLIVKARIAGVSHGFFLFDDTGSEWTRDGEKFTRQPFPNRFFASREEGSNRAPYLLVTIGPEDRLPPETPREIESDSDDLPAGEAWVSWITPRDQGRAGTIGFFVKVDGRDVPRYLIPLAAEPGQRVRMHLRDLITTPGKVVSFEVRAVDGAGNLGKSAEAKVKTSALEPRPIPGDLVAPFTALAPLPSLGDLEVAVVDELDKLQPITGEMIPSQPLGYLGANHLWSARDKLVRLHSARNEFVAFQIVLKGKANGIKASLRFDGEGAGRIQSTISKYRHVNSSKGPLPDPIVDPADQELDSDYKTTSLHVEVYVPHDAIAGERKGKLLVSFGGKSLELGVQLTVWTFTLPDRLSFLPEMNSYGLPENERDYYRLAHKHRTVLNRLAYHHDGTLAEGAAPRWDGKKLDWTAWDRRFGPYLDGSAFADLPRKHVPVECFYLPVFENWPTPIGPNYNGSYWADEAFTKKYRQSLVDIARAFSKHINERKWNDTLFQFFLNGKNDFKSDGWSRSTSPWLLDEPAHLQDFWALRYFGLAFREGADSVKGKAKVVFRCDISRPQWQRDTLDGLLGYNVVGGAVRQYLRIVLDRKEADHQTVLEYGSANAIEDSNVQPLGWSIDAWSMGVDGVLPWQTIGNDESWTKADTLSLFYPARNQGHHGPIASIRLKAYRRGQQDVEYLTLLAKAMHEPRWALGKTVRQTLALEPRRQGSGLAAVEDAGVIQFSKLKPQDVWALRVRIGQALSKMQK